MPKYEYVCKSCGERIEVTQSFKDEPLTVCSTCQGTLRKVFSSPGIVLRGPGFYRTDYRGPHRGDGSKAEREKAEADGEKAKAGKDESGSGGKDSDGSGSDGKGSDGKGSGGKDSGGSDSGGKGSDGKVSDGQKSGGSGSDRSGSDRSDSGTGKVSRSGSGGSGRAHDPARSA